MALRLLLRMLVVLCVAAGPTRAWATLIYAGGEQTDFICNGGGTCQSTSGAGLYRSGWARSAYAVVVTTSDPPTNRFATPVFPETATLWVHAQYCTSASGNCVSNTSSNAELLRVMDSAGYPTLIVRGTGATGQVKISSRTSSGAFTDLVTCSSAINSSLTQIDLFVNYGVSGEVALYSNSVQVCDFSGNVTNGDGGAQLNQIEFAGVYLRSGETGNWSEVIAATDDTRAMARFSAFTVGNGAATNFSGTNVCSSIWNNFSFNDSNYGYSSSTNIIHECTVNSSVPAGSYNVLGLVMSARALVGSSGPQHFNFVTRVGGTDYNSPDFAPAMSFSHLGNYIQTVNPATGNPWAISDFQASGFNVGEETKP